MKILIIEKNTQISRMVQEQIRIPEDHVTTCPDAASGLAEACQHTFYPVIMLDLTLPGMDGVEFCRRLRATQQEAYSMVLVVALANQATEMQRVLNAGADGYLVKPVSIPLLQTRLAILERQLQYFRQHKQVEDALRELDEQLELAITGSNGGLWSMKFSPEAPTTIPDDMYLSPQLKEFIGFEDHEFPNSLQAWQSRILPEDLHRFQQGIQNCLQGRQQLQRVEYRMRHKEGSTRWLASHGKIQRDEQGSPIRWAGIAWDITERKQMENILTESEERFRSVFEHAAIGMGIQQITDSCLVAVNRSLCKMLGYKEEDLLGSVLLEFTHSDDRDISQRHIQQLETDERDSITYDKRYLTKHGNILYVISSLALVKDYQGAPRFIIEQIQDITERKHAEATVRKSAEQYCLLIENVADGIGIIQKNVFVFVNKALGAILGRSPTDLIGTNPIDFFHPKYKDQLKEVLSQSEHGIFQQSLQSICVTGDGREIWIEERHSVIQWEGQSALILTMRDITADKLRELANKEERSYLKTISVALKSTLKDRYRFGDIIGKSQAMRTVYELILTAAASDVNVIISGESGTGKELVARTIHALSKHHEKVFAPVNCGAITESLFESKFFGHCKGAFTGAHKDQSGVFDHAHGGTLFLDEVGELDLAMQVKLLRVLAEGQYTPVGDYTIKEADVRLIAATNQNLQDMVEQGALREDFFFRIHVLPISIPPLREHREDIPLLIEYFLDQYCEDETKMRLPGNIFEQLYTYDWPGNVRELQNVLQRYLTIRRLDFVEFGIEKSEREPSLFSPETIAQETLELQDAMAVFEKRFISEILNRNQGHRRKTAAMLGIPLRTLYRKIKRYHLTSK